MTSAAQAEHDGELHREIDARDPSSVDIERIVADGQPVLLRGYCRRWRAFRAWELSIFERKPDLARRVLPVSLDNEEQQSRTWRRRSRCRGIWERGMQTTSVTATSDLRGGSPCFSMCV